MKREEIDILLGKYYEGTSSEEEENLLRDFFNGKDLPAGYEAEKAMFVYYQESYNIPEASYGFEEKIISALEKQRGNRAVIRTIVLTISGIAAGFIILTGSWFLFLGNEQRDTFKDPEIAYAETIRILYEVSAQMNKGASSLEPVAKMNIDEVKGLKVLVRSRETLEKNMENLDYLRKVVAMTKISEEEKK